MKAKTLSFDNNFLLGFDTCRWIAASHRNVLPVSISRMEGLGPSLNTKVIRVRTWFGYTDQLQERWPVRITETGGNRAKYIVGSVCLSLLLNWPPSLHPTYITKLHCHPNYFSVKFSTNPSTLQMEACRFLLTRVLPYKTAWYQHPKSYNYLLNTKWHLTWRLGIKCWKCIATSSCI